MRRREFGDELSEVGGRPRKHRAAQLCEPRFDLGIGETRVDCLIELVDDFGGRAFGRTEARPEACLKPRKDSAQRGVSGRISD
jgi:hypothetical protein